MQKPSSPHACHLIAALAVGQPNLAEIAQILARDADGVEWLYFVYGMREADGSVNQRVGRVRRR